MHDKQRAELRQRVSDFVLGARDPDAIAVAEKLLVAQLLGATEEAPADDADAGWSLDGAVPPGRTAAVALVEHLWAESLRDAIRTAGGTPLGETWLAEEDLDRLSGLLGDRSPS